MAAHGDERSPVALDRTSTRAMVEKGEGSDGVERAARHGAAEGLGGGWEKLCRLAMAAKAVAPAAAERRRAKACVREFQREPVDAESSGAQFGGAGHEAACGAELGCASAMAGHAPVHGCHDAISSNTWRARWSPTWSPFSAYFVHIRTLAPVAKLLYSGCSTNLIKAAWSLEQ